MMYLMIGWRIWLLRELWLLYFLFHEVPQHTEWQIPQHYHITLLTRAVWPWASYFNCVFSFVKWHLSFPISVGCYEALISYVNIEKDLVKYCVCCCTTNKNMLSTSLSHQHTHLLLPLILWFPSASFISKDVVSLIKQNYIDLLKICVRGIISESEEQARTGRQQEGAESSCSM